MTLPKSAREQIDEAMHKIAPHMGTTSTQSHERIGDILQALILSARSEALEEAEDAVHGCGWEGSQLDRLDPQECIEQLAVDRCKLAIRDLKQSPVETGGGEKK